MRKRDSVIALGVLAVAAVAVAVAVILTRDSAPQATAQDTTATLATAAAPAGCATTTAQLSTDTGTVSPGSEWTFPENSYIRVKANVVAGCTFSRWAIDYGDGIVFDLHENPARFQLTEDITATAHFTGAPRGHMLGVTAGEGGSVTISPAARDDGTYASGTVVTLSATADKGYDFGAWTGLPEGATVTAGAAAATTTSGTETSTASFTLSGPVTAAASFRVESTPYNLHTTGTVTAAGSYALLSDPNDLTSTVDWPDTNYPFGLLLHMSDAGNVSRASFYGTVTVADRVDWWWGHECLIRFKVIEVRTDPAGMPARKLFVMEFVGTSYSGCQGQRTSDALQPVEFRWRQPPWLVGSDGIRSTFREPVPGPGRYRVSDDLIVTIPAGMSVRPGSFYEGGWYTVLRDVESDSTLWFDESGNEAGREIVELPSGSSDETETGATTRDVNALFDQIAASVEVE